MLAEITAATLDRLLLDVTLPGQDGLPVLRERRKSSTLPVIMLTARA